MRRVGPLSFAIVAIVVTLTGCGPFANWGEQNFDGSQTSDNPNIASLDATAVTHLAPKWTVTAPGALALGAPHSVVTNVNHDVFATGLENLLGSAGAEAHVYRFDEATGALEWRSIPVSAPAARVSGPALWGDDVYVVAAGRLYAFDATSGQRIRWSAPVSSPASSPDAPVTAAGLVLAFTSAGLTAFDAGTGAVRWSVTADPRFAAADNVLYTTSSGMLREYRLSDGTSLRSLPFPSGASVGAVVGTTVYAAGTVIASIDGTSGATHWSHTAGGCPVAPDVAAGPSVVATLTVCGTNDYQLVTFATATGTTLWTQPATPTNVGETAPVSANGVVYTVRPLASGGMPRLEAFDGSTGSVLFSTTIQAENHGRPSISDGMVLVPTLGHLDAFAPAS